MSESPKLFTQYDEIRCRPNFDSAISITTINFECLISPYQLGDDVICQVEKKTGRCGHKHLFGWLGRVQGGKEGLIGGHCAKTYFKGDARFIIEQKRIKQEMAYLEAIERLGNYLNDREALASRIREMLTHFRQFKAAVRDLENRLPPQVITFLKERAKTGQAQVEVELRYVEMDEQGKEKVSWHPQTIGMQQGLGIWLDMSHDVVSTSAKEIDAVAKAATLQRGINLRKLQGWLKVLDELANVEEQVEELHRQLQVFTSFSNLCLLIFLLRDESKQVQLAELALVTGQNAPNAKREASELRKRLYKEIKAKQGRDFRGLL